MLKRQKQVTVRFTEEEYHQLKNKCDAAGMKMEPFLRAVSWFKLLPTAATCAAKAL